MNAHSTPTTGKIDKSLPVLSFHRTNSNAKGKPTTYFAHPDLSGVKLPLNTFDVSAHVNNAFFSTAWEIGYKMGAIR
nr:hypothetical protein [uncultured Desulfobacter sp.]